MIRICLTALALVSAMAIQAALAAEPAKYSASHAAALKALTNGSEPIVKDAMWTAKDMLKVGVIDNGKPRDGFAQYLCEVLADHGLKGQQVRVQVVDIVRLKNSGKWVTLGQKPCD